MIGFVGEIIYNFLIVLLDTFCCKILFDVFSAERQLRGKQNLLLFLLSALMVIFSLLFNGNYWLKEIFMLCAIAVIMKFYSDISFAKSVVFALFYLGILMLSECVTLLLRTYCFPKIDLTNIIIGFLVTLLSRIIGFFLIVIVSFFFRKKKWSVLGDREWLLFLFFPVLTICMIAVMLSDEIYLIDEQRADLYLMIAVGLILMNIMVFYLLNEIAKRAQEIQDNKMFALETRNLLKLYENLSENVEKQRELSHDFHRQISVIKQLNESGHFEDLNEYLSEFKKTDIKQPECVNTNHIIVNAVLNEKYGIAMENHILLTIETNDLKEIPLKNQDIAMLLSNLLDNALEACEQCTNQKWIRIKMLLDEDELVLAVKNTCHGERRKKNGEYLTTKKNELDEHGHGLKNIIRIIEAYNGEYAISEKYGEFYISISIPRSL